MFGNCEPGKWQPSHIHYGFVVHGDPARTAVPCEAGGPLSTLGSHNPMCFPGPESITLQSTVGLHPVIHFSDTFSMSALF